MPTNASTDRRRPGPAPAVAAGAPSTGSSGSRPRRATRCCTWAAPLFALLTIYTSTNGLYQVWGRMALAPFAFGAVASRRRAGPSRPPARQPGHRLHARRQHRRAWVARIAVAVCVFAGALAIPLGLEILWRFDGVAGSHLQPEVRRSRSAARTWSRGRTRTTSWSSCRTPVKYHAPGEPNYAGLPALSAAHGGARDPERHLAQQRPERRPHLLLPDDAGGGRGGALSVPGGRAAQDPRAPGPGHPAPGVAAAGDRGRRHPGRGRSCSWPWCWPSGASPSRPASCSASRRP